MRKSILLLSFTVLSFISSFAKEVDMATAMKVAKQFYATKATVLNNVDKQSLNLSLAHKYKLVSSNSSAKVSDDNLFYIFNVNTNDGFIIIAGDDIVTPILGYGNKGNCDDNNLPPAFKKWLENYKNQILFAIENEMEATDDIKRSWDGFINPKDNQFELSSAQTVNPLCNTTWNQNPYYNSFCPGGSVSGCVATAMAQIMKYWNYPATGTSFHSYNHPTYGTQSANFASTNYNWGAMPNNVSSANSAVATLMYQCGVSVNMQYSPTGSNAYVISSQSPITNCSEYAYKTYFGYNAATLQGLQRSSYSNIDWKNLLKNELDNNRPIQYAGFGSGGGHAFVCDGYDASDFFHMNWGWGGNSDGYFELNALNPGALGSGGGTGGYNASQQALIGIQPSSGGVSSAIEMYSSITINPNPIDFAQPFTVNADVINNGTNSFSGDYSAAIFTSTGDFIEFVDVLSASGSPLPPGFHYTGGLNFSSTGILSVPGSYIVGIFFRDPGGNWNLVGDAAFTNPISVNINSPVDYIQQYSPIVTSPSTFVSGQAASVNVNLINDNSATYFGVYRAALYDLNGNFVQTIGTYNETSGLPPGYTYLSPYITFNTSAITAQPGTYILTIEELENGFPNWYLVGGDYYSTPITIDVVAPPLLQDIYESNNTQPSSYTIPLNWVGNNAHPLTYGSNNHIGTDYDFYKINLAGGFDYTITARVHDSYNSGNGNTYSNDVLWSYDNGGGWSLAYDDVMPGNIIVNGSSTVYFQVAPYFAGQTGTYLLDIDINRVSTVGIDEISNNNLFKVFPNPASNILNVKFADNVSVENLTIKNIVGQNIAEFKFTSSNMEIDLSELPSGMYFLEAIQNNKTYSIKFIVNK